MLSDDSDGDLQAVFGPWTQGQRVRRGGHVVGLMSGSTPVTRTVFSGLHTKTVTNGGREATLRAPDEGRAGRLTGKAPKG